MRVSLPKIWISFFRTDCIFKTSVSYRYPCSVKHFSRPLFVFIEISRCSRRVRSYYRSTAFHWNKTIFVFRFKPVLSYKWYPKCSSTLNHDNIVYKYWHHLFVECRPNKNIIWRNFLIKRTWNGLLLCGKYV